MSAPRIIRRQGEYCPKCSGDTYYEFSMTCTKCTRTAAAESTRKTIKLKRQHHEQVTFEHATRPIKTDAEKEKRFMAEVKYD